MFDVIFVGVASAITSLITASLGLGGGVLLLALLGQILPTVALIPIHGVGQFSPISGGPMSIVPISNGTISEFFP